MEDGISSLYWGEHLAQQFSNHHSISECPREVPSALLLLQLPAIIHSWRWHLVSLPPMQETEIKSEALVLLSLFCCRHLVSEPDTEDLHLSAFQIILK